MESLKFWDSMHKNLHNAILSTLCYSDIFNFPLTAKEIWKYLISDNQHSPLRQGFEGQAISNSQFKKELDKLVLKGNIRKVGSYYCLPKRESIIAIRKRREKISEKKIKKAQRFAHILSYIPTVQLIALSGSVAMSNAEENADIDIFVITSAHTLWITRLVVFVFLRLLGVKRGRHGTSSPNTICANMFMEEGFLTLPQSMQNLYTAHEFAQLKILVNKHNEQEKLFAANTWIKKYMPNSDNNIQYSTSNFQHKLWSNLLIPLEHMFRTIQLWYMRPHKTREITEKHLIAFHPIDYANVILEAYNSKTQHYGV